MSWPTQPWITDPKTADLLNRQLRALRENRPLEDAIKEHELQYVVPYAIAAAFWALHPEPDLYAFGFSDDYSSNHTEKKP